MIPRMLTRDEVAKLLRVSTTTIAREQKAGRIRAVMVGNRPVYLEEDILAYIEARHER